MAIKLEDDIGVLNKPSSMNRIDNGLEDDVGIFQNRPQLEDDVKILGTFEPEKASFIDKLDIKKGAKNIVVEPAKGLARGFELIPAQLTSVWQVGIDNIKDMASQQLKLDGAVFGIPDSQFVNRTDAQKKRIDNNNKLIERLDRASDVSKKIQQDWLKAASTGIEARNPEIFRGSFMQNPSWTRALTLGFESAPLLGVAAAVTAVSKSPVLGSSLIGALEASDEHIAARNAGKSIGYANTIFLQDAVVLTALETVPLTGFMKGGALPIRMFRGGAQEGGEEVLQQLWKDSIAKIGYDPTRNITAGLVESFIGGWLSGGIIGGFHPTEGLNKLIDEAEKKGVDIDAMITAVGEQIVAVAPKIEEVVDNIVRDDTGKPIEINAAPDESESIPIPELKDAEEAAKEEVFKSAQDANLPADTDKKNKKKKTVKSKIGKAVGIDAETGLPIIDRQQKGEEKFTVESTNNTADGKEAFVVITPQGDLEMITSTEEKANQYAEERTKEIKQEVEQKVEEEKKQADVIEKLPETSGLKEIKQEPVKNAILEPEKETKGVSDEKQEVNPKPEAVRGTGVSSDRGGERRTLSTGNTVESSNDRTRDGDDTRSLDIGSEERNKLGVKKENNPEVKENYKITDEDLVGEGGPKSKHAGNVAAIKILKQIESENRLATPEEKKILVKYVGMGGLSQSFDIYNKDWRKEYDELKALLTEDEYKAARASTINAHYTAPEIIKSIWRALSGFGFHSGRVLEPSAGVGHFIGLAPQSNKKFSLVELDSLTGRIAKHLYQNSDVQVTGYQDANLPANFYDVVVSNIPFSDYKPFDQRAKQLGIPAGLVLHDYFFAKSLVHLKPGGMLVFITSKGTMDKGNIDFRKYLNSKAKFIGAIRLPSNAFKKNAGTEVVTDIIFLQKPFLNEEIKNQDFIDTQDFEKNGKSVLVNKYFLDNPDKVLGDMSIGSGLYTNAELTVTDTGDFQNKLDQAIESLPKDILTQTNTAGEDIASSENIEDHTILKEYGFTLKSGKIFQKVEGKLVPQEFNPDDTKRMVGILGIRDAIRDLLSAERNDLPDKKIEISRKELNKNYDAFVSKHGHLNTAKNEEIFSDDPDSTLLLSLEDVKKIGKKEYKYSKTKIFQERVLKPHKKPTKAKDIKDAIFISLGEYSKVDWKYVGELLNKTEIAVQEDALKEELVFRNPNGGEIVLKDEYLSGNVKVKLKEAQAALKIDKEYERNVKELSKVIPKDLTFDEIYVRIGMPWISLEDYREFLSLIGVRGEKLLHNSQSGAWLFERSRSGYNYYGGGISEYGTSRMSAKDVFEKVANGTPLKVFDKTYVTGPDGTQIEKKILNEEETALAEQKADLMKEKFSRWFWEDNDRREKNVKYYNENRNHTVVRKHDGSHLVFPSMSKTAFPEGLRKTQLDAISRGIVTNRLMLAHAVGAGKTAIITIIAMESKRLGITNKSMVVAPKNTIPGWKLQINKLYPSAKILIANEKTFSPEKRKKFLSKIAFGDWDIIVIPETSFGFIQASKESYEQYVNQELDELRAAKEEVKAAGGRISVKNIEKAIFQKEQKLKEFLSQSKKDDFLNFEELGIDALYVDEADKFKNLSYTTMKQNIKGMGTELGVPKASDMMMKVNIIRNKNGKIVFATGTPISNSMVEAYTQMKYLQPEMLAEAGIKSFDDWSNTFGEIATNSEVDITGGRYKVVSRFKNFINLPELMKMIRQVWDIQTQGMLEKQGILVKGKNLPLIKGGKPQIIIIPQSEDSKAYTKSLVKRFDDIKKLPVKDRIGKNHLFSVFNDGKAAALDMRMIDPTLKPDPNSKIETAIVNILKDYKDSNKVKGTQVVFIDITSPDKTEQFNPHYYMKKKLIAGGIPANEIAFIHDYPKEEQKDDLYQKVNDGDIRVIFGSTEKLGAGTNIQERLYSLHHVDLGKLMRPRDIIQREGRIVRPGNINKEVNIYRYATKGSLDTFVANLLESKSKTIDSLMESDDTARSIEEEDINEYEALKALSSENPMVKEKSDVDREVKKLKALNNAYIKERGAASETIKTAPLEIDEAKKQIKSYEDFIAARPEKPTKEKFSVTIGKKTFTDKKTALEAIWKALSEIKLDDDPVKIGTYLGYDLHGLKKISMDKVDNSLVIKIPGGKNLIYGHVSSDPIGTFTSLDGALFSDFSKEISYYKEKIDVKEKAISYAKDILDKGFSKEKELQEKVARQSFLDKELKREIVENLSVADVEKEIGKSSVQEEHKPRGIEKLFSEEGGFAETSPSLRKKVNDKIEGGVSFTDPEVEQRYKNSKGVPTTESLISKIKMFFSELYARATRVHPQLPNKPEYAQLRNILSKQRFVRSNSQDRTIRAISAITAGFGHKKLDLFTRSIILNDLVLEAEAGRLIPFGYSEVINGINVIKTDLLLIDKKKIDDIVAQNPDVKEAIEKRNKLWTAITNDLVSYEILKEEEVKKNYYRHQILAYVQTKTTFGTGKRLKSPRQYAQHRLGSTHDINTDYVQADFEVMSQALHDIETAKNIKEIENSPLNIADILKKEAKESEEDKLDWHELIPATHTTWQPLQGNVFFMANSISNKLINQVLNGVEVGVTEDDIKKILAVGDKRKEFVLPLEVADTLNNLYEDKNPNWIATGAKALTTAWKKWILMNPRRFLKYNFQNFIGDFDALIAGDHRILKRFNQAFGELIDIFYRDKPMTDDMREFIEFGGLSTQMTIQELPELRNLEIFQRLSDSPGADLKRQLNLWQKYWQTVGTFTTFRESIFRYAAYLHYKQLFNDGGKINYGASIKAEIDALKDPNAKAAKVSTELLGDYANISALGKDMRELVMPFYSWLEINTKRYSRLFRNAFDDGWQKGIGVSATVAGMKGSFFLAKWTVRAMALTALVALYNNLFFKDEEDELSDFDKNRMHIVIGRDKDGNVKILTGQSAFADLIEWFGLNASPTLWREYFDGKSSLADIFGRIPNTDLPAFGLNPTEGKIGLHPAAMKILRGINPLFKLPFETLSGKTVPVFDDKSWKVEDKFKNILKSLSLENEYDFFKKEPSRGYVKSLMEMFITTRNPEENAYRYIQGEKYKFLETVKGRGASGGYYTAKSMLYRKYKKALRFEDTRSQARIKLEMDKIGITNSDLKNSLEMSNPLSGLNNKDTKEFLNQYLTKRDREIYLPKALKYYEKTFKNAR